MWVAVRSVVGRALANSSAASAAATHAAAHRSFRIIDPPLRVVVLPPDPTTWAGRTGEDRSAEAEDELRVVRHLLGRPRRLEGQLALDLLHVGDLPENPLDVLLDH